MQVQDELTKKVSTSTTVGDCLKKNREQNPYQDVNCIRPENYDNIFKRNTTVLENFLPGPSRRIGKSEISSVISKGRQDLGGDDDYVPPTEPPPMPEFKSISKRVLIDIDEILEYPGRTKRPER